MKVCSITIYMNDVGDDEVNYTAVMEPGGYIGKGVCPQDALSDLPEVIARHVLKRPHSVETVDVEAVEHWLCEPGQRYVQWVKENRSDSIPVGGHTMTHAERQELRRQSEIGKELFGGNLNHEAP